MQREKKNGTRVGSGTWAVLVGAALLAGCSGSDTETAGPDSDARTRPARREDKPSANAAELPVNESLPPQMRQHGSDRQRQRAARSLAQLKQRKVPVYNGPLFVDDDEEVKLQSPQEVARRTLVLWAVELRAEGIPQEEALGLIEQLDLWDAVSPAEKRFLEDKNPDPDQCRELVWRLESIWVLMWALGYVDELDWPRGMCDVPKLVEMLKPHEANAKFITGARLRSKAEILDAQDLTMRIHWAIRDAWLNQRRIPADLDWSQGGEMVEVGQSAAVGVVEQRHYVLNWLVDFLEPQDWDHVDTPT